MLTLMLATPFTASAGISISEIVYDPDGSDTKREWVEIFNTGPDAVNLTDWKFVDKSNHALNVPPKNGGVGSMLLAPGRYAILASDAATFVAEHPGISIVIDTALSLNNSGGTLAIKHGTTVVDSVSYSSALGAAGDGDSLQLNGVTWIAAAPTPGLANATTPSVHVAPVPAAPVQKKQPTPKQTVAKQKSIPRVSRTRTQTETDAGDPLAVVNATPTEVAMSQTAAAGSLGGSNWWFAAAAALAVGSGAVASLISRQKKNEWDIEESE